ncbi:MAG: bifunctional DNA-formamidopyrimidine glycosylase/DNA-(apurinic or apyrimidinic site) lyase [Chloroflexi bacterium]|nr:bifunctional DNA-formamidopyrimidine glycosylase/DNA-(apurinic or apyrimidinic site) lyase [Chloroflexota bacterium]
MPELPEVETYARDLAGSLTGRRFEGARVDWPRQLPLNAPAELDARIRGQVVEAVGRRGKYIVLDLSADQLLVHLKMSGRLQVAPADSAPNPHAYVVLGLDGGDELRFHDPRKFGRIYLLADPEPILGQLGPEPLDPAFTLARFRARLAGRRGRLKPLLLDQAFLAGLGNIYVDESLWQARLHPLRPADTLAAGEQAALHAAIVDVLTRAVAARGTSFSRAGYRDLSGNMGEMQGSLRVFQRHGQPCPRCGRTIERMRVGQRGTHLCPGCQPPP